MEVDAWTMLNSLQGKEGAIAEEDNGKGSWRKKSNMANTTAKAKDSGSDGTIGDGPRGPL